MRTNTIDATAFRCLQEYTNLIIIYNKLFISNDNINYLVDYLEELINFKTLKDIRDKHMERVNIINKKIDKHMEDEKNKIKIGCPYRQSVVDENIQTDKSTQTHNVIIDTAGNNLF